MSATAGTARSEIVLRPLRPEHRERVREIVRDTGAFRASEVDIAL